jgi:hypothetical protein
MYCHLETEVVLGECQIATALADGGNKTKATAVPVLASSRYPVPTSQ